MNIGARWLILFALTAVGLFAGIWAGFWPRGFYDAFPGFGHRWVSAMPPYNEHLIRDVGTMYLALSAISLVVLARPDARVIRLAGLGWLTFNIPHAVFHLMHLHMLHGVDRVLIAIVLIGVCLLAAVLVLPSSTTVPRVAD